MKIAIIGYSGSGKSTLAGKLGAHIGADVLHLDSVHHMAGWQERSREESQEIVKAFMDSHSAWVIDGNYSALHYERRMEEADRIILLLFNRFSCLARVLRRYWKYRGQTRPDMGEGCTEKVDAEFVKWILRDGRKKKTRERYRNLCRKYPEKVRVVRNQRQLNALYRELGLE